MTGPRHPCRPPSGTSRRRRPRSSRPRRPDDFDTAIGTGDAAEITAALRGRPGRARHAARPVRAQPHRSRRATDVQAGIALVDRPGADTGSAHRATLAEITADRGRPIGEGQYVVHDTDALRLPYLPDPYAAGVSLVFYEAGAPHALPEPRALQAVTRAVPGHVAGAAAAAHRRRARRRPRRPRRRSTKSTVTVPPGEQVRVAVSSTVDVGDARAVRAVALAPGERRRPRRRLHDRRGRRRGRADAGGVVRLDVVAHARRSTCASCTPFPSRCGPRSSRR